MNTNTMQQEHERVLAAFDRAGFTLYNTGGGTMVLARWPEPGDGTMQMATHGEDGIPEKFSDPVYLGTYTLDADDCYDTMVGAEDFESVTSFLARWI